VKLRRRVLIVVCVCAALAACATTHPALKSAMDWSQRMANLQEAGSWKLDGRAAVAVGTQGWQATLNWQQQGQASEVHLAGPFGMQATVLSRTPEGVSINGAAPNEAEMAQLQQRLGFDLPLDELRFWLLGVPDPGSAFDLKRNPQDRAQQLTQAGWSIDYDRYMPVGGDLLPSHLVLNREDVRVRIVVDHWETPH
jgi:outer membrane lipoprotein LolB